MEVIVAEVKKLDNRAVGQLSIRLQDGLIDTTKERCIISPQEYQWLQDYVKLTEHIKMLAQPYIFDKGIKIIDEIKYDSDEDVEDDIVIPFYLALIKDAGNLRYNHLKEEWERLQAEKEKLPDIWFM